MPVWRGEPFPHRSSSDTALRDAGRRDPFQERAALRAQLNPRQRFQRAHGDGLFYGVQEVQVPEGVDLFRYARGALAPESSMSSGITPQEASALRRAVVVSQPPQTGNHYPPAPRKRRCHRPASTLVQACRCFRTLPSQPDPADPAPRTNPIPPTPWKRGLQLGDRGVAAGGRWAVGRGWPVGPGSLVCQSPIPAGPRPPTQGPSTTPLPTFPRKLGFGYDPRLFVL